MAGSNFKFYEFFSGGGLARKGLGAEWECLFANDICPRKSEAYRRNFNGAPELTAGDIKQVSPDILPRGATLAWASFPCQDLSLAGPKPESGLSAKRSGCFWPFWELMTALDDQDRGVPIIVLENVAGLLCSNKGKDFSNLLQVITKKNYKAGALVIDAERFVPQSRPRLFIIAVKDFLHIPGQLLGKNSASPWLPHNVLQAYGNLPDTIRKNWIWWNLPVPAPRRTALKSLIDNDPAGVKWHSSTETEKLLSLMSGTNVQKVRKAQDSGGLQIGTVYRRTRKENGKSVQRAEVRFDGISGCLRTPAGGSSRQIILAVEGKTIRSRLLAPLEAARLMGLDDGYKLPEKYNDSYHLMGDAVVVPVVKWLESHILAPLCRANGNAASQQIQDAEAA